MSTLDKLFDPCQLRMKPNYSRQEMLTSCAGTNITSVSRNEVLAQDYDILRLLLRYGPPLGQLNDMAQGFWWTTFT